MINLIKIKLNNKNNKELPNNFIILQNKKIYKFKLKTRKSFKNRHLRKK